MTLDAEFYGVLLEPMNLFNKNRRPVCSYEGIGAPEASLHSNSRLLKLSNTPSLEVKPKPPQTRERAAERSSEGRTTTNYHKLLFD